MRLKKISKSQYEEALVEEVEEIKKLSQERVDSYLEYVADEWFTEKSLTIESGLKTEMTESFLTRNEGSF
jgi:hypothetical protein